MPLPGYQWVGNPNNSGNSYVGGYPASILLHQTVSRGISASYISGHPYPPHCWANVYNGDKFQTIELGRAAMALYQPSWTNSYTNRKWHCIQTELVGVPEVSVATYSAEQCNWIAANVVVPQVQWLRQNGMDVNLSNVRYHPNTSGSASEYWSGRMSDGEWGAFDGLCAHIDVVGNDHWDCSAERLDWIAAESRRILGGGSSSVVSPPPVDVGTWPGVYLENYTSDPSAASWQAQMVRIGYPLDVDGEYGPASETACMQFQVSHGLVADGIVGPVTWNAVFGTASGSAPSTPPPATVTPPPFVDSGNAPPWPGTYLINFTMGAGTAQWQQQMANRGWTITVDDQYGSQSEEVCMDFQQEKGLDADGVVGPATWAATWEAPVT